MPNPLFVTKDPLKALVAVMDVRLQSLAFAGELSTKAYLNMQVTPRLRQAIRRQYGCESEPTRENTYLSSFNRQYFTGQQPSKGSGPEDRARTNHGCRDNIGHGGVPYRTG